MAIEQTTWAELSITWPDRIGRYRWRNVTPAGWPDVVQVMVPGFGWSDCPSVGVRWKIAEHIREGAECRANNPR